MRRWYVLKRLGSRVNPRPLVEFDWGSQSTRSDLTSAAAKEAARLMAVVVLPTPPFWLATAITRPMGSLWRTATPNGSEQRTIFNAEILCKTFHVEQFPGHEPPAPTPTR